MTTNADTTRNAEQHDETVHRVDQTGLAWRAAGEEIVVLDTDRSIYFGLDRTGALLWRHLVDGATVAELTDALVSEAPVEPEQATEDVCRFLDELRQHGLLPQPRPESTPSRSESAPGRPLTAQRRPQSAQP